MKVEAQTVERDFKASGKKLTEREQEIVARYYGLAPFVRHTLQEIGDQFGVTRERIRQIKAEALKKIAKK